MNPLIELSDFKLEEKLQQLVSKERELQTEILRHISEVMRRRLYLHRGFSSLFDYLTRHCKYSAAAAQRRIEAVRLMAHVPELEEKIESGKVNLSQVAELQRSIRISEKTGTTVPLEKKQAILCKLETKNKYDSHHLLGIEPAYRRNRKDPSSKRRVCSDANSPESDSDAKTQSLQKSGLC